MKTAMVFLSCFLFCTSIANADEILVRRETTGGKVIHSFSNTNVNTEKYGDKYSFRDMTAAERAQADRIAKANNAARQKEADHNRRVSAEIARARAYERQLELYKSMEKVNRLGKKYNIDAFDRSINIEATRQPRNVIDVTTGRQMIPAAGGIIDPGTGTFHVDAGAGYVDSKTGAFSPKLGQ